MCSRHPDGMGPPPNFGNNERALPRWTLRILWSYLGPTFTSLEEKHWHAAEVGDQQVASSPTRPPSSAISWRRTEHDRDTDTERAVLTNAPWVDMPAAPAEPDAPDDTGEAGGGADLGGGSEETYALALIPCHGGCTCSCSSRRCSAWLSRALWTVVECLPTASLAASNRSVCVATACKA